MKDICTRCGEPAAEAPKGKGFLNKCSIMKESIRVHSVFSFKIFRFTPWTENPGDQVRMVFTEFTLCNPCAGDVFTFAVAKVPRKDGV